MKRLECLDGLRGCLAVYVLLGHLAPFALLPGWLQSAVSHGGAAVDVFFVLSGLVITQCLSQAGRKAGAFLRARVLRIFPVFLLAFTLAVAVQPWSCGFERMPWIASASSAYGICSTAWPEAWLPEIIAHLTMTHGLFPDSMLPNVWVSFLGSAWSLSTEWQFYLLAVLAAARGRSPCWFLLALATAGIAWRLNAPDAWQFSRAFLANKSHFFALGMASAPLVRQQQGAILRYGVILSICLVICATEGPISKMLPPLVWTLCLAIQLRSGLPGLNLAAQLLRSPAAQHLGAISYCLYLINEPVHKLVGLALSWVADGNAALFTLLWLPAAIGLPLVAAFWLHRYVEAPAVRWGRSIAADSAPRRLCSVAAGGYRADNETSPQRSSRRSISPPL